MGRNDWGGAGGEGFMGGFSAGGPTLLPKIKIREEEKQVGGPSAGSCRAMSIFPPSGRNPNPSLLWRKQTQLWKSHAIQAPASLAGLEVAPTWMVLRVKRSLPHICFCLL